MKWDIGFWVYDMYGGVFLGLYPNDLAIGPDGSIYVTNTHIDNPEGHCVIKLDSNGNFLAKWGTQGSGYGEFDDPTGIAVTSNGFIIVADSNNNRIQALDSDGFVITTEWGIGGNREGEFQYPEGIATGADGSVYVVDAGNSRIQKFDSSGNFITKWGTPGTGNGQFYYPEGIAVGPDSSVYVASDWRIQKFDNNGNFITKWGSIGTGDGQFDWPFGIAVGPDGAVYVTDKNNHRIQKFGPNGNFIGRWGAYGSGDGQFNRPSGIAAGPDGSVYVTDESNNRIQKFDRDGNFIMKWGSEGTEDGQFRWPLGVAIGSGGFVYVADTFNERIQQFDSSGTFVAKWGNYGTGDGQFILPSGIALAPDGSVYVTDYYNHRIQKMIGEDMIQTIYETTLSIYQTANSTQDYTANIGPLNVTAKFNLQTTLTNSLGQTITQSSYPFYMFLGNTVLLFNTDKKVYNPGETGTITGRVENRGTTDATNLVLTFQSKLVGQSSQLLYTDTFDLPAGGSHPFTLTTSAGVVGTVILKGAVSKNNSTLVEIKDQYEVVNP